MIAPTTSRTFDYEIELAIVIGKRAKNIRREDALDYIAGYTVFNDGSVRGLAAHGRVTIALMKNADKTAPLGPELVTPDELPAGADGLQLRTWRNGKLVQDDTTANMFWKVPEIIELSSSYMTFEPGDVIVTGTCGGTVVDTYTPADGTGMENEDLPWLREGDELEMEIEGIGRLRNRVAAEPA